MEECDGTHILKGSIKNCHKIGVVDAEFFVDPNRRGSDPDFSFYDP
jgi:hypothetical protein